jgi:hypothetical protein
VVSAGVIAHGTVWAGGNAFTTANTALFDDGYDAGFCVFANGFGFNRAGAEACWTLAVLASQLQEVQGWAIIATKPDDAVSPFAGSKAVFGFAGGLTAFAADAAFQIDHQG